MKLIRVSNKKHKGRPVDSTITDFARYRPTTNLRPAVEYLIRTLFSRYSRT